MLYTIQFCRGVAALMVVFFHAAGNLAKERYFGAVAAPLEKVCWFGGDAGVAFFFVLSGFIIFHIHRKDFDRPEALRPYVRKRITRIYPTYLVIFSIVYLLVWSVPSFRDTVPTDPTVLIKALLLWPQDKNVVGGTGAPVIVAAWSLQYELIFYIVFGLALIKRWLFGVAALALLGTCLLCMASGAPEFPLSFLGSHLILLFGMGLLAGLAADSPVRPPRPGWLAVACLMAFAALAFAATHSRAAYPKPLFDLMFGAVSAVLIFALVSFERAAGRSVGKSFAVFGEASYSLYLLHFPLIAILSKLAIAVLPLDSVGMAAAFIFLVVGSVAAGIGFHVFIERPMQRCLARR